MGKRDRSNLDRILRSAWERQIMLAGRQAESERVSRRHDPRADYILACLAAAMAIILVLVPPESPYSAFVWLTALFGVCIYPIWHLGRWLWNSRSSPIIALTILVFAISAFGYFQVWPQEFIVQAEFINNGDMPYALGTWDILSDSMSPVGIEMYLRIINGSTKAQMVDSVQVDIKTEWGQWETLPQMDFGDFYVGAYPNLYPLKVNYLNSELSGNNLSPGGSASGWVFFDYPKAAKIATPDFRLQTPNTAMQHIAPHVTYVIANGTHEWGSSAQGICTSSRRSSSSCRASSRTPCSPS